MNIKTRKLLIFSLIFVLIIFTCILYFGRVMPRDFSSFLPDANSIINSCIIDNIDQGSLQLDENNLIRFLSILKDTQYYYDGHYGNTCVGNLYRVQFLEENNGLQSVILAMSISDEGIAYIGNKQYSIRSESNSIMDFLQLVYVCDDNFDAKKLGKHIRNIFMKESQEKDNVLCYVNGIEISQKKFDIFRETRKSYNRDKDDDTLLKEYIQFILIVNEAEKEGFTVSESEVEDYTNDLFESLEEDDDENMKILKEYIDGMGITMDEYKEKVKEFNYKVLLTMKLHKKLNIEFLENNKKTMTNSTEISNEFNNYLKDYKEELYNNAEKIMNNK